MSVIKGIKVGTADITSSYTDITQETDTKQLEVVSVELGYISSPSGSIYTGMEQSPTPNVTAFVDGEERTLIKDTDYVLSYKNNINVGTATVTATGIGNFSGTVSSNWIISPADMTVVSTNQSYLYNGQKQGSGIDVTTVSDSPEILYGTTEGVYDMTEVPRIKDVSESGTIYYQVTAPNHYTKTGSYELFITPVTANLSWGNSLWKYDGEEHSTTCVVSNLIGNDVCDVILSGNSITDIGSVTVTATALSNTNYTLPLSGLSQVITINPVMFVKISGMWQSVKEVYKKIDGVWIKQTKMNSVFKLPSDGGRYLKK